MKKRTLYGDGIDILLALLLIITIILVMKCCSGDTVYADQEQTIEMIHYQQSEGRFAVEENGYINIRP